MRVVVLVVAVLAPAVLATPQYGAAPRRPQKVWTTTPFPDEASPANNDIYQQPQPQYQPQPQPQPQYQPQPQPQYQPQPQPQPQPQYQPQPQPQYQPQPQPQYQPQPQPQYQPQPQVSGQGGSAPSGGGNYWWASGSRPFSAQAMAAAPPPQPAPVSPGNPFLNRPQSGGYGPAPTAPQGTPCNQPGQVCVPIGQCQGGYVAPGANGVRQGQCSSSSQTCCQQRPQQQPQPSYSGGYGQPQQLPRPQPQPQPSYGVGYNQPQPQPQTYYQPQPTPGPYTGPLNTTPYPGCAAALKCVEEQYCTAEGVMSNSPVYMTREQQENRVPLSECQNPDTGIIGKCCRDPNYKDPWPGGMMMKNMPAAPAAPPPPPPPAPAGPIQDTCANSGGVCVLSQQCPSQSRMQPEQDCVTLISAQPGKCCSYSVNTVGGGSGGY